VWFQLANVESPSPIWKTVPHLAFAVDDPDAALEGKQILIAPNSDNSGV
jgi:hypothetical protein